jgi:hypothetical protein
MAKSHITKKHRNKKLIKQAQQLAEQQVAEELKFAYVDWWVKRELERLVANNVLIIHPEENKSYRIAYFKISQYGDVWHVTNERDRRTLVFSVKSSAVFYCLFEHKQYFDKSQELLIYDRSVQNLESNRKFLNHKYKQALEKKDEFAQDLCEARLSDVVPRLDNAKEQLQKILNSAKYIKLWDTKNHEIIRNRKQGDRQAH